MVPLLTELTNWSKRHYQPLDIPIQPIFQMIGKVFERNANEAIPKSQHMELKKLFINIISVLDDKDPALIELTQVLVNTTKSAIKSVRYLLIDIFTIFLKLSKLPIHLSFSVCQNERVEVINKSTIGAFLLDLLSTRSCLKTFMRSMMTLLENDSINLCDVASLLTILSTIQTNIKSTTARYVSICCK